MNLSINKSRQVALRIFSAAALTFVVAGASAQDTTSTSVRHGEPSIETQVRNATVAYVEGNNLVLKLENGKVEHLIVPFDEKFHIDGKETTVTGLKAGTKLTQTITTTTTPRYVNTVRGLKGKVWHVNAPGSVILSLPDGTNHLYKVPSHAKFKINGQDKTVFELKKGMNMEATIVTDSTESVVAANKSTTGEAPTPALPTLAGVLLIQPLNTPAAVSTAVASADHPPAVLPETASSLPFTGLLGLLSIASAAGLGIVRRRTALRQA